MKLSAFYVASSPPSTHEQASWASPCPPPASLAVLVSRGMRRTHTRASRQLPRTRLGESAARKGLELSTERPPASARVFASASDSPSASVPPSVAAEGRTQTPAILGSTSPPSLSPSSCAAPHSPSLFPFPDPSPLLRPTPSSPSLSTSSALSHPSSSPFGGLANPPSAEPGKDGVADVLPAPVELREGSEGEGARPGESPREAFPVVEVLHLQAQEDPRPHEAEAQGRVKKALWDLPGWQIGFTKSNELLVGRVAMLGFGASLIGEALTGKGPLAQLNMETGIPIYDAEPLLLFFILFTLVGAVRGLDSHGSVSFHDKGKEAKRVPGRKAASSLRGMLGLPETGPLFSFSTSNEVFVGRMAQLGFAFALIGEILTGKGALAQLRIETGIPVAEMEPLLILSIAFFVLSAINPETGRFFRNDEDADD